MVPSNPDKRPLCSASLLQVTGCVNITWLIGCDKSCTLLIFFLCIQAQCPAESSACIQISARLAMNWPLCLSLQIKIIKANAVPLCAVAMGTGTGAASSLLFALAGNQSVSGGWDWTGKSGRWCGLTWDGRGDTASWGTPRLCPAKQEATAHWPSLRKGIRFSWPPLPCHQPYMLLLILTRSACVTTDSMTPPPANLTVPPSPHSICLLWRTCLKPLQTDTKTCSKCDNINSLPKINKAAVHSP